VELRFGVSDRLVFMPTYEYKCRKCGHQFEAFQSIKAAPLKRCPKCRGQVRRLLGTGAGVIFKGSGFYATDYRSPTYQKAARAEQKSATESKPPADKTTSKPASS